MYILSKYKDYYDHFSGIYGVDKKIVLDRREAVLPKKEDFYSTAPYYSLYQVALCGEMYYGAVDSEGNWWWNERLKEIAKPGWNGKIIQKNWGSEGFYLRIPIASNGKIGETGFEITETDWNDKYKCPILMLRQNGGEIINWYPRLADLGFPTQFEAKDIYLKLVAWLGKRLDEEIPNNMSNSEKIEAKGFDIKRSFRKMDRE